ncbi:MAG: methyltransferase domain-containing protein [bacterium]|nr:methyltransferase domain-containing protein [bacterium]
MNIDFHTLVPQDVESKKRLASFTEQVNQEGGTYHRLNFGSGIVIQGIFDLTKYLHFYNLPENLTGKTVLDIGTASGFFALESARRGAQVTAIDIYCFLPKIVPYLAIPINYQEKSIYELEQGFGQFDLVICGSLLMHLPEPFEAIRRIRRVCRDRAIISTQCFEQDTAESRPICEFIGQKASDENYYTYWKISAAALRHMMLVAGFTRVENEKHFPLVGKTNNSSIVIPHVVMTGYV